MAEKNNLNKIIRDLPEVQEPPVLFKTLKEELEQLLQQSKQFNAEGAASKLLRRAKLMVSKGNTDSGSDLYGSTIAKYFPTKKVQDCVKQLQIDPLDSQARIGLIEPFALKGIKGNLLVYRQVLLHALLEASSSKLSSKVINMVLMAQRRYLDKIAEFFKEELSSCQFKLSELAKDNRSGKEGENSASRAQKQDELIKQMDLLKQKLEFVQGCIESLKGKQVKQEVMIELKELSSMGTIPKDQVANEIAPMLGAMVTVPLLRPNTELLVYAVKKGAPRMPVGGLYESKMHRIYSKVLFAAYTAGYKDVAQECGKVLFASLNSIQSTLGIVGNTPSSKLEKSCVREYGMVCHIVFQQAPLLGFPPPSTHTAAMQRAVDILQTFSDEAGVLELVNALGQDLVQCVTKKVS